MHNSEIKDYAERLVRLEDQAKEIRSDIVDLKKEADAKGINKTALSNTVRIMRMDEAKRKKAIDTHNQMDLFMSAVGLLPEWV